MSSARVLFIGHGAERTGPPIHLLRLVRWMAANGCERPTIVVARDGELVAEYRRWANVVVVARGAEPIEPVAAALRRLGRPEWGGAASHHWLTERLRRIGRHDLVYVNTASPATLGVLRALPDDGTPVLLHVHELDIGLTHNLTTPERSELFDRADRFAAVCAAVTENLVEHHGLDRSRITTSPGFVDDDTVGPRARGDRRARDEVRQELGVPADGFVVATAALPDWRKAPDLFLRVGWTIRRTRPDVDLHLLWVGGDPASEDSWRAAHEAAHLGLGERFHLIAHRPDPSRLIAAADLYAVTAREDAFPLAALEAAALARPIACFAAGGTPELVADDGGLVVPYPDCDAMAAGIVALHDAPEHRAELGRSVQDRVRDRFVTSVVAPRLWQDVIVPAAGNPG